MIKRKETKNKPFDKPHRGKDKFRDTKPVNNGTSWQNVSKWYNKLVGEKGQYFHEHVIFPKLLKCLKLKNSDSVLDLGCGQGILARKIPQEVKYVGVDISESLIRSAKNLSRNQNHNFFVGDITKPLNISKNNFTICTIVLALQNVEQYQNVFRNAASYLQKNGRFVIVINHPYFRIPRVSGWGIDEGSKKQYRKLYSYMSPQKISIDMTPGGDKRTLTWSFHFPLQDYISGLAAAGFVVEGIEEWVSDKTSVGKAARMENKAREEFPMFMMIVGRKN